jgi:rubrerythrin
MTNEYLNFIILLENAMGSYYQKIKNLTRLEGARAVLEFMETHSFEHAAIIEKMKKDYAKPAARESMITDFHNNLLNKVYRRISEEKDILKILDELAASEESVGKLYQSLAGLMTRTAEHYTAVAARINEIAEQEFGHRDLLLKDRARLAEKAPQKK